MHTTSRLLAAAVLAALLAPGCRSLGTGGGSGAAIGSAVGAGAGYAIGSHNDDKWAGTAIGALAGGIAGWFIGDSVEPATHEVPLDRPAVQRTSRYPSPPLPDDRVRVRVPPSTDRVIVRDIYPDGTVRERVVPLD